AQRIAPGARLVEKLLFARRIGAEPARAPSHERGEVETGRQIAQLTATLEQLRSIRSVARSAQARGGHAGEVRAGVAVAIRTRLLGQLARALHVLVHALAQQQDGGEPTTTLGVASLAAV